MDIEKYEQPEATYRNGISSDAAVVLASASNVDVVLPKPAELFIDIDSDEAYEHYQTMLDFVRRHFWLSEIRETCSKEGFPHRHVVLEASRDLTSIERIALQAILGSDPKREILSFIRIENKDERPTLFFERKEDR